MATVGALRVIDERIPRDLPWVERDAVRVVVRDSLGRVLLFHARDALLLELGTWWELPGGGLDQGETYVEAAVRELREEAGIAVAPDDVGPPLWRRLATFRHRTVRHVQREVVVVVDLRRPGPDVDETERLDYELEDYFAFRWWPVSEVVRSSEQFYPGRLPELLPRLLASDEIDEPLEIFS
jgi:8-oxo-dGTP pyrophosphatase MutT (NUDIX family)